MTPITAWLLAGALSCLIALLIQRHALRSLAMGVIRFDLIQAILAVVLLVLLLASGPIGLVWIVIWLFEE